MITENQLLNHIYQTAEMGGEGIEAVLKYADEPKLVQALNSQLSEYRKMQRSAGEMLRERGEEAKGTNPMAKVSSEMMSAMKTMADHSATKIAEMMIQGNTMGVTKSIRTIRDCTLHDERVRDLANKLLKTEEANIEEMKRFL
ncbi:MAG: hypothetical protein PUB51_08520 [Oscillospiraceae bacterium]|nr:hypothetical protein [Oscillospiraceae bacterium]